MTPIEASIRDVKRWIDSIQTEKDAHALTMAHPDTSPIAMAFCGERLTLLDQQLHDARHTLAVLEAIRYRPELMFTERPRMARMTLAATSERKLA